MGQPNLRDLKVLVVDDISTVRAALAARLQEAGIETIEKASDGADAIDRLRSFSADLAICDLNMLPLDGIEFTRLIRNSKDSPNPYLPIIMLTGEGTRERVGQALAAGVNDFMSKPVSAEALRQRIEALFAKPLVYVKDGNALLPDRAA